MTTATLSTRPTIMTARANLQALWRPAAIFAASRAVVLITFVVAAEKRPVHGLRAAAVRWDGGFYLRIVREGYPTTLVKHGGSTLVFFPSFPLITRAFTYVPGLHDVFHAGFVVVVIAGFAAACLFWLLTRELADPAAADRATALFAFAPGAFVLSMTYSEGILLCSAIAACWAFMRHRWILGGVIAAVGTASRPNGVALVIVAVCSAYLAVRRHGDMRALVAPPLAATGVLAFHLYLWIHTGEPGVWFRAERQGWNVHFTPLGGRIDDFESVEQWLRRGLMHGDQPDWNHLVPLLGLFVFAALFVLLLRWRPPIELIAFTVGVAFFAFTSDTLGFRPRFVMTAFPLTMALGVSIRRPLWFAFLLVASIVLTVVVAYVSIATNYLVP